MKELYKGHSKQLKEAGIIGNRITQLKKEDRILKYYENPVLCKNENCRSEIPYEKKLNLFCSKSCSASFNNTVRLVSETQKEKIANSLRGFYSIEENLNKAKVSLDMGRETMKRNVCSKELKYNTSPKKCKVCDNPIEYRHRFRITCSEECRVIASTKNRTYQNGSRKPVWFFNKYEGNMVLLESSWEVRIAKLLDRVDVRWIRPNPIKWFDGDKHRYYYPDFYLTDFEVYLDPKNPYCMETGFSKMKVVSSLVNIIYGDILLIEKYITDLT